MEAEIQAPVEVDVGETFDRDVSDLDIPGFGDAGSGEPREPAAIEASKPPEDEKPTEQIDEKVQAVAEVKAAVASPKKVTFKQGESTAELAEDAVVEWKVDGQPQPVALKELLQNYSGKVAWEKRFNEVANERKQFAEVSRTFEAERERHKSAIVDMHKAATEGRTLDAVAAMLRLTGTRQDPREYLKSFRSGLMKQAEELAKLTPEQRQAFEDREEIAYLKSSQAQTQQQRAQEQAQQAFQERVVKAIKFADTTTEEYANTREWLQANGQKLLGKEWDPAVHLTPEYVANQIRDVRDYRNAREALNAVDPKLAQNETVWKQAVDFLRANPEWTLDDLKDVYRQATQEKRSQAISKKVAKAPVATTAKASATKPKKSSREDFSVFDEADASWD